MSKKIRTFTNSLPIPDLQIKEQTKEQSDLQDPQFDDEAWNEHTEEDVKAGELDTLIQQAVADFLAGRDEEV
ncbi:hypothetical protein F4Y19_20020 [Candidatus Poribacteria bacterium]|nr:hypothetical protein [Candidatus Poribacteria bacterium]